MADANPVVAAVDSLKNSLSPVSGFRNPAFADVPLIAAFWIIFIGFVLIPWICFMVKWVKSDANFMDLGSCGKVLQLDSYRRIQDERDREEELEKAGGFLTAAMFKEKTAIDLDPLKDKSSSGQLAYWYYLDMVNNEIGPLNSAEMRERWLEGNYHMHMQTQVREAWWPEDQHYGIGEIFPNRNESEIFVEPPTLPQPIVDIIEHGIQTGSRLPSKRSPSVAVLRTSSSKDVPRRAKSTFGSVVDLRPSGTQNETNVDRVLDEVEHEIDV